MALVVHPDAPSRRTGKSQLVELMVAHALAAGLRLAIATRDPAELYRRLRRRFPDARLQIERNRVLVPPQPSQRGRPT